MATKKSPSAKGGIKKEEIKKIIADIAEIPQTDIKDNALFAEDLGIDSMMALEIAATIEKKFKIPIPEEEIPKIRSLNNICEVLEKLSKKNKKH